MTSESAVGRKRSVAVMASGMGRRSVGRKQLLLNLKTKKIQQHEGHHDFNSIKYLDSKLGRLCSHDVNGVILSFLGESTSWLQLENNCLDLTSNNQQPIILTEGTNGKKPLR
ncbi:hypothetical protein AVEN_194773-1 [Araneus ventricosus]|uniref:Uncharacterized protein n=1 Tax=Araneus ventricosus TaxID=182803 RepID=A0A4Y2B3D6_ARAVE|nr:hypothetical protein AVEN_194773-1 [Araneus ventricosus]